MTESISADVIICPACKVPFVTIDGVPQGKLTFFKRQHRPCVTAHAADCQHLDKPTPYPGLHL